ncbi:MAG TPA: hypothetical protein VKK31_05895 [Thermoanaerobaculia bacterium]|nr:hypothetical protein [Thermoanaerobaculia bacterium]
MKFQSLLPPLCAASLLLSSACATTPAGSDGKRSGKDSALVGPVTRETVEAAVPDWVQAEVESQPDAEAAHALASVAPGAEVTVLLGTWCSDSRREVSRLWKALDETGGAVPFEVHYVGVDGAKREPAESVAANGVLYLPTFIVRRGGREVGRIVETAPHGIEKDLLALLTGEARGILATREDLAPSPKPLL